MTDERLMRIKMLHMGQTIAECDCPQPAECTAAGQCLASSHDMYETQYIRLTDLTKLRIARTILLDCMVSSLPNRDQISRWLAQAITRLEDNT